MDELHPLPLLSPVAMDKLYPLISPVTMDELLPLLSSAAMDELHPLLFPAAMDELHPLRHPSLTFFFFLQLLKKLQPAMKKVASTLRGAGTG